MHWSLAYRRKLAKSLRVRGFGGTVGAGARYIWAQVREMRPAVRRARRHEAEFDRRYSLDTRGIVPLSELDVREESWIYGNQYEASTVEGFDEVMQALDLRHEEFTFIDLGSGKGRALLLASRLPFRKIVGVELSRELNEICLANIRRYPREEMRCHDIEANCGDAARYELPPGPLVIYLANPFGAQVMRGVLGNVRRSLEANPREVFVVYYAPEHAALFDEAGLFRRATRTRDCVAWRYAMIPADAVPGGRPRERGPSNN